MLVFLFRAYDVECALSFPAVERAGHRILPVLDQLGARFGCAWGSCDCGGAFILPQKLFDLYLCRP